MKLTNVIALKAETLVDDEYLKDRVSFNIVLDTAVPDDKIKVSIPKYGTGSAEDWLKFLADVNKVVQAKQWSAKPQQLHSMYGLLLKGQAEALYVRHTSNAATPTVQIIKNAITEMTREYLPIDCAKNTSRYLLALKKPYDMTVENFYTRVKTIDSYLPLMLPPMNVSLSTDQITSLLEHAVPSDWLHQLNLQQTLGQNLNLSTMIQYFKVLEVNERKAKPQNKSNKPQRSKDHKSHQHSSDDDTSTRGKATGQSGKTKQQSGPPSRTSSRTNPTGKWCTIHKSTSHNTAECRANTSPPQDNAGSKSQESNAIESNRPSKSNKHVSKRTPKEEVHQMSDENQVLKRRMKLM